MRRALPLALLCLAAAPDKHAQIEQLLGALQAAPNEQIAAPIETRLAELWIEQGSPATTLLMTRGLRDLSSGDHDSAYDDFDAAIALEPDLPEPWLQRAIARQAGGDSSGAIADISEAIRREPRLFPALKALSRIAESRDDWKGALSAWQKVLEIDPETPGGAERLKDLRRRALGENT